MLSREKGRKKTKQVTSTQYKVTDPISMADLENIHLRKGKLYPSKPPPQRILKTRRERALSPPLEMTSTDAMDTKEAQEISREIAEKAAERELKMQKYAQYQKMKQVSDYKVPRAASIPVPDLNKSKQGKERQPPSVLSNFDVPQYEEISGYSNRWQFGIQSASATPRLSDKKGQLGKDKPNNSIRKYFSLSRLYVHNDYCSKQPLEASWQRDYDTHMDEGTTISIFVHPGDTCK